MNIMNAKKQMGKLGTIIVSGHDPRDMHVIYNGQILSITEQGGKVIAIHTKRVSQEADYLSDYYPGRWHDSMAKAVRWVKSSTN